MKGIKILNSSPNRSRPFSNEIPSIERFTLSTGKKISLKERSKLYQMIGILLDAGLSLPECLSTLGEKSSKKRIQKIVWKLRASLESGTMLSEAIAEQSHTFSEFEQQSLGMAEKTGRLVEVLQSLHEYYDRRIRLRRKMVEALSYPVIVVGMAILVLSFMLSTVVPMFEDIFARFDAKLPLLTQYVLNLSEIFREGAAGAGLFIFSLILAGAKIAKHSKIRLRLARWALAFPIAGKLLKKTHLARLGFTLSQLLAAEVPLDQALLIQQGLTPSLPFKEALGEIRREVIEGESFYEAVSHQVLFPPFFIQIIRIGEKTARLPLMLEKLASSLEEESEAELQSLSQFLEPILIILLGIMVSLILVAMYLPMFELSLAMGG